MRCSVHITFNPPNFIVVTAQLDSTASAALPATVVGWRRKKTMNKVHIYIQDSSPQVLCKIKRKQENCQLRVFVIPVTGNCLILRNMCVVCVQKIWGLVFGAGKSCVEQHYFPTPLLCFFCFFYILL